MRTYQQVKQIINNAAATTTSPSEELKQAGRVSFFFRRTNHASGNTVFTVQVSPNNIETPDASSVWVDYAKLISNVANTNVQNLTRVASVTLNSNSIATVSMSPEDTYRKVRVIATRTTDGNADVWIVKQYTS